MAAYLMVQVKITRPDGWPEYRAGFADLIGNYGGRYLVRGGDVEVLEGGHDGRRVVVVEFPDMDAIHRLWASPAYATLKKLREGSGELDVWAVPGS